MNAGDEVARPRFDDDERLHDNGDAEQGQRAARRDDGCAAPGAGVGLRSAAGVKLGARGIDAHAGLSDVEALHAVARYLLARQIEHHASVADADHAVGIAIGEFDLMQHAEHGELRRPRQLLQQPHDLLGRFRIEARDRLVGQQHARPLRQCARDRDALLLAAGERAGALFGEMLEPDLRQMVARRFELGARQAAERSLQGVMAAERAGRHIGQDAAAADEARMLRDHRELEPRAPQLLAFERAEIGIAEPDFAGARPQDPGDRMQQRRLAAAVAAEDHDKLARLDIQIEAVQHEPAVWIAHRKRADT